MSSFPIRHPNRIRYYYDCDCGSKWSMVFETGDGQPRMRQCFKCKRMNRHTRFFKIPQ